MFGFQHDAELLTQCMQITGLDEKGMGSGPQPAAPISHSNCLKAASLVRTDSASMLRAAAGLACRARSNTKLPQICASAVSQCADVARESRKIY